MPQNLEVKGSKFPINFLYPNRIILLFSYSTFSRNELWNMNLKLRFLLSFWTEIFQHFLWNDFFQNHQLVSSAMSPCLFITIAKINMTEVTHSKSLTLRRFLKPQDQFIFYSNMWLCFYFFKAALYFIYYNLQVPWKYWMTSQALFKDTVSWIGKQFFSKNMKYQRPSFAYHLFLIPV